MANPIFTNGKDFKDEPQPTDVDTLQAQFDAPSATAADMGRMSYEGVTSKTASLLMLALVTAVVGYLFPSTMLMIVTGIAGFVLGLFLSFSKKVRPALTAVYALVEGYFLGAITIYIETAYEVPGAGLQALGATGVTFAVVLFLYRSGRVRYTSKMRKFLLIGGISYLAFSLINLGVMVFSDSAGGFGMRSDVELFGFLPLGVVIGVFAVILACVSLIGDFDYIERAVKSGAPASVEWRAAFGLILTLVWIYIEFLRIIAIVFGRR